MRNLERLKIGEARLTLAALRQLKDLPKLKELTIYETDISDAEIASLRTELPKVTITFEPLTPEQRKKLEMYLKGS